jgi:hypothetical protein
MALWLLPVLLHSDLPIYSLDLRGTFGSPFFYSYDFYSLYDFTRYRTIRS